MTTIDLEARRSEILSALEVYLNERPSGVGSSDTAAILGLSRYRGVVDVWKEKVSGVVDEHDSAAMRRGRFLEAAILARYQQEMDRQVETGRVLVQDWRRAQLDGLDDELVVEAKSVAYHVWRYGEEWGDPGTDEIPEAYLCQVQWQLDMADRDLAHVPVAILPGDPSRIVGLSAEEVVAECQFELFIVERSPKVGAAITKECETFWKDNVLRKIPPEPRTFEEAQALWWSEKEGTALQATDETKAALAALQFARGLDKLKKNIEDRAKFDLAKALQDIETLSGPNGEPWLRQKVQKRRAYTVKESESKPMRILKDWKSTPEAKQVEAMLAQLQEPLTHLLPS